MTKTADKLPKGILHPLTGERKFTLARYPAAGDTGYFVQHYWIVRWDLRGQEPHAQTLIAYPNVNMIVERNNTRIYGVARKTSAQLLQGQGWVVGVKFKPGGFYPFLRKPVSSLTGGSMSFEELFGVKSEPFEDEVLTQLDDERMVKRVDTFVAGRLPERDPNVELISGIVKDIQDDRTVVKVEDAVRLAGMRMRTMQRMFDRYVGVSPKSVIQRWRLHDAAERIDRGEVRDWLELSVELGYYDHSHFIRDFRSIVGLSPEEYRQKR